MIVFTGFIWTVIKGSLPYQQLSERAKIRFQQKTVPPPKSLGGVLEKSFIIYLTKHKKCNQEKQPLIKVSTEEIERSIKKYVQWLQDWEILKKIQNVDFAAKEIHYHNICRVRYQNKATFTTQGHEEMQLQCNKTEKRNRSDWHISRNVRENAFETLIQYIQEEILEKKEVH